MTRDLTKALMIADSIGPDDVRLCTLEVKMHPSAVEHFLTHRAFARNGASKRAIPLRRQIQAVLDEPVYPLHYGSERPGMVSGDELNEGDRRYVDGWWDNAREAAINAASEAGRIGLHKEAASRVLAPFVWRTYVVSATDWQGFFSQRLDRHAQYEIRRVAHCIRDAMAESTPRELRPGQWHLPYVDYDDRRQAAKRGFDIRKISTARCARVSYLTHNGVRDLDVDVALVDDKLQPNGHWSPFEHVATPSHHLDDDAPGCFRGWMQYRHLLETVKA